MTTPYYQSPSAPGATGRLLLLSYHFAPSEEAGALRWQKLARYVAQRGLALDVVALDPSALASRDDRRLADLPPGTRVFGASRPPLARESMERVVSAILRMARTLRRTNNAEHPGGATTGEVRSSVPDSIGVREAQGPFHSLADLRRAYHALGWMARDEAWAKNAAAAALRITSPLPLRAVVSCGPPHMVHAYAAGVARRLGAPLVADLRDPWSLVERVPEPLGSRLLWPMSARAEARALHEAALIVTNTEAHRAALQRVYPDRAGRMIAVLNGFDEDSVPAPRDDGAFVIAYAGTIYLDRDPRPLLRAARRVVERRSLTPERFRLVFMGEVKQYAGATLEGLAREAGIGDHVEILGVKPRREALAELARADQLVVLPQDSHLAVPSKLYEYMVYPAAILALAHSDSAVATTLAGTGADVVAPDDVDAIAAAIDKRVEEKSRRGRPAPITKSAPHLGRATQARTLLDAIQKLSS